jgi:hypothetical protein
MSVERPVTPEKRPRFVARLSALFLASVLALSALGASTGCGNMCLLTVNGQCQYSNCGDGEAWDSARNTCVCQRDRILLGGSCMTQLQANKYCGKGGMWTPQGCVAKSCPTGAILDQETDQCVDKAAVDRASGVGAGQTLSCAQGLVLVVTEGQASCIPVSQTCQKDEYFDTTRNVCLKMPTCQTGQVFDAQVGRCVIIQAPPKSEGEVATVDVVQWSKANYGTNGGPGAQGLCGPLAKKPLAFAVMPGGSIRVRVTLDLSFANPSAASGQVATSGFVESTRQPVTAKGALEIQQAADTLLSSLREQKANASVPKVQTVVNCLIVNGAAPVTVPTSGGA